MDRMVNDTLVNRVADAIENCDDAEYPPTRKTFEAEARAVLATLGLDDDLDAAVVRGASAFALHVDYNPNRVDPAVWGEVKADFERTARIVLEAALTATDATGSPDG